VIPKLRKCLTSLHTCFSAFDHNPTSQLPGNREHLHTHITQPIFKLAMIHSSYEINKFIKSLVTTLVFVRYHTQFSGFIKQWHIAWYLLLSLSLVIRDDMPLYPFR